MQVTDAKEEDEKVKVELQQTVDIYRDTPIRLLGYANEVGESFRSLVHVNVVRASYFVAFSYVFADTVDKTQRIYIKTDDKIKAAKSGLDCLIWQTLASVAIPGYTINRLCATSLFLLRKTRLPTPIAKWTTTLLGLGSIPLIFQPIDHFVDYVMDNTYRKLINTEDSSNKDK